MRASRGRNLFQSVHGHFTVRLESKIPIHKYRMTAQRIWLEQQLSQSQQSFPHRTALLWRSLGQHRRELYSPGILSSLGIPTLAFGSQQNTCTFSQAPLVRAPSGTVKSIHKWLDPFPLFPYRSIDWSRHLFHTHFSDVRLLHAPCQMVEDDWNDVLGIKIL
jgi:hypothetical protein